MGIFKSGKQKIDLGEWKKKVEITIPTFDLDLKLYNLPVRIGSSVNNDIVVQDSNIDQFQIEIVGSRGNLFVFNLSKEKPANFGGRFLRFLDFVNLSQSIQVNFDKVQFMLMPEVKSKKEVKPKQVTLKCPYCGEIFNAEEGCPVCGFGKVEVKKEISHKNFSKALQKIEEHIEKETVKFNFGGVKELKVIFTIENGPFKGNVLEIPESNSEITIGRSIYNAVSLSFLEDQTMSRFHCKLNIEGEKVFISDNNSLNGTYVNGKQIKDKVELHSGDVLQIGRSIIRILIKGGRYE
jgi:hypothetical protein